MVDCPNRFYKLIFMDLNMPVMDGFESARRILKFQEDKSLKQRAEIVALTAYTNTEYQEQCRSSGMSRILHKPAKKREVEEVIKKYCPSLPCTTKSTVTFNQKQ